MSKSSHRQVMGELGGLGVVAFGLLVAMYAVGLWRLRKRVGSDPTPDGQFAFHLTTALATAPNLLVLDIDRTLAGI